MAKYCVDCSKPIYPKADRCFTCTMDFLEPIVDEKERKRILDRNIAPLVTIKRWCIDCGKKISRNATRCRICAGRTPERRQKLSQGFKAYRARIRTKLGKNYCVDCGKGICNVSTRCRSCAAIHRIKIDPGHHDRVSRYLTRAWARGAFDNRKAPKSPTRPEKDITELLDESNVDYQFNTLKIGRYTFDFYLPGFNILIEYDGWLWHKSKRAIEKGRVELDAHKDNLAKSNGYYLIRIPGEYGHDLDKQELSFALLKEFKKFRRHVGFSKNLKNPHNPLTFE